MSESREEINQPLEPINRYNTLMEKGIRYLVVTSDEVQQKQNKQRINNPKALRLMIHVFFLPLPKRHSRMRGI